MSSFHLSVTFRVNTSYNSKLLTVGKLAFDLVRLEVVSTSNRSLRVSVHDSPVNIGFLTRNLIDNTVIKADEFTNIQSGDGDVVTQQTLTAR